MTTRPIARIWTAVVAAALVAGACSSNGTDEVVLLAHDSFAVSDSVVAAFEEQTGLTLRILQGGDAGEMLNQAILTKDSPTADVIFGVDNTFLSRAVNAGLFEAYESPRLAEVPPALVLDPDHRVTPIDYGDVCVNFDREAFATAGVRIPVTLQDLADPTYSGKLVVENPATSSPGLAFMLATIATFGETGTYTWRDYWADLVTNDVLVTAGWTEAYELEFSGGSGTGDRPLVVSYATSPPAEVLFAPEPVDVAPTGVIPLTCFRQVEFAGILANSDAGDAARELVDFMLSPEFQQDVPLSMFVFPAVAGTPLPEVFTEFALVPEAPISLDPAAIEEGRDRWLDEWTEIVR